MQSRRPAKARSALLRAHAMRASPTQSEALLWAAIRGRRLGVAFRRQVVIGECIVDFLAPACRLVVEVDGAYHMERVRADARRDAGLERLGYRVLRLSGALIERNLTLALDEILRAVG